MLLRAFKRGTLLNEGTLFIIDMYVWPLPKLISA